MEIIRNINGSELTLEVSGRLDTNTAPQMEEELGSLEDVNCLILDFQDLRYVSSAGLRILLTCQKKMNAKKGSFLVKNVCDDIYEVFDVTGFSEIINIQRKSE